MRYNTKWDGKCLTLCEDKNPLSVTEIIVPDGIEFIDEKAFRDFDNLERIVFPKSCNSFEAKATQNKAKLKEIIMPSIEDFGGYPFLNCDSLLEFTVPETVKVLYPHAFGGAHNMKKLIFTSIDNLERSDYAAFFGIPKETEIIYPSKTNKPVIEYDKSMGEYTIPEQQLKELAGKPIMEQARSFFMQEHSSPEFDHNAFHAGFINGFFDEFPKVKALIKDGDNFVGYVVRAYGDKNEEFEKTMLVGQTVLYAWERHTDTSGDNNGAGYKGGEDYYSRTYLSLTWYK